MDNYRNVAYPLGDDQDENQNPSLPARQQPTRPSTNFALNPEQWYYANPVPHATAASSGQYSHAQQYAQQYPQQNPQYRPQQYPHPPEQYYSQYSGHRQPQQHVHGYPQQHAQHYSQQYAHNYSQQHSHHYAQQHPTSHGGVSNLAFANLPSNSSEGQMGYIPIVYDPRMPPVQVNQRSSNAPASSFNQFAPLPGVRGPPNTQAHLNAGQRQIRAPLQPLPGFGVETYGPRVGPEYPAQARDIRPFDRYTTPFNPIRMPGVHYTAANVNKYDISGASRSPLRRPSIADPFVQQYSAVQYRHTAQYTSYPDHDTLTFENLTVLDTKNEDAENQPLLAQLRPSVPRNVRFPNVSTESPNWSSHGSTSYIYEDIELTGVRPGSIARTQHFFEMPVEGDFHAAIAEPNVKIYEAFPGAKKILDRLNPVVYKMESVDRVICIKVEEVSHLYTAIKTGRWSIPDKVGERVTKLWEICSANPGDILLIFSVNGQKSYCGLAKLTGPWTAGNVPQDWRCPKEGTLPNGTMPVEWIYVKNVSYDCFQDITHTNGQCIVNMWNGMYFPFGEGRRVIEVYVKNTHESNVLCYRADQLSLEAAGNESSPEQSIAGKRRKPSSLAVQIPAPALFVGGAGQLMQSRSELPVREIGLADSQPRQRGVRREDRQPVFSPSVVLGNRADRSMFATPPELPGHFQEVTRRDDPSVSPTALRAARAGTMVRPSRGHWDAFGRIPVMYEGGDKENVAPVEPVVAENAAPSEAVLAEISQWIQQQGEAAVAEREEMAEEDGGVSLT